VIALEISDRAEKELVAYTTGEATASEIKNYLKSRNILRKNNYSLLLFLCSYNVNFPRLLLESIK
jgi:hypothetical protein